MRKISKLLLFRLRVESLAQAAVEFAVVSPLIMLILLGIFDLGRAVAIQSCLANAAHEGVREALYSDSSEVQIRSVVRAQAYVAADITDDQIVIAPTGSRSSGNPVTVTVSYDFVPATPMIGAFLSDGKIALKAAATMVAQ